MMNLNRRQLLGAAAGVLTAAGCPGLLAAAEPPQRSAGSHLKLSLAGYSFNRQMVRRGTPEQLAAAEMTLEKFIAFCAKAGIGATELTGYYFPQEITNEYLLSLRSLTHREGLAISGTAIGNNFCLAEGDAREQQIQDCLNWIDYAAVLGAPCIRIFAGTVPKGDTEEVAVERCAAAINRCLQHAAARGVFLALENHGGITATSERMLQIIDQVDDSPWFGVNFDSGNFRTEHPLEDLRRIAPYAVNAEVKATMTVAGEQQPTDYSAIVQILRDAGYRGYVALEYEERESPYEQIPRILDELRPLLDG
jgi:sugar phosphate isomerase/epimerase